MAIELVQAVHGFKYGGRRPLLFAAGILTHQAGGLRVFGLRCGKPQGLMHIGQGYNPRGPDPRRGVSIQ